MSSPPDDMRLRALLEQVLANGNAAIIERDRLREVNTELLKELINAHNTISINIGDTFQTARIKALIAKTKGETT
jgi:rRNA pseudouridine-1189 N-methylase Emg1 (Nep1/Mra1 family)